MKTLLLLALCAGSLGAGSCLQECRHALNTCKSTCGRGSSANTACYLSCLAQYQTCTAGCPQ